jgi:hypothetical protein
VVEQWPHHPQVEGSTPASTVGTGGGGGNNELVKFLRNRRQAGPFQLTVCQPQFFSSQVANVIKLFFDVITLLLA